MNQRFYKGQKVMCVDWGNKSGAIGTVSKVDNGYLSVDFNPPVRGEWGLCSWRFAPFSCFMGID